METRTDPLVRWQWNLYSGNHTTRANLLLHVITVPIFWSGLILALLSPVIGWWALGGLLLLPLVMAIQGRGHQMESTGPVPFNGPLDVVSRIFLEQLFTFPRYVLTGGLARAWKAAGR